jgi:hypothetical protein
LKQGWEHTKCLLMGSALNHKRTLLRMRATRAMLVVQMWPCAAAQLPSLLMLAQAAVLCSTVGRHLLPCCYCCCVEVKEDALQLVGGSR